MKIKVHKHVFCRYKILIAVFIYVLSPCFLFGQKEHDNRNKSVAQLNFECTISNCNFTLTGNFVEDLATLRNDDKELYSDLGPDIQGESSSSPLVGHPVAYTSGNTLKINLLFEGSCAALSSSIMVRGVSSTGYEFPPQMLSVSANTGGVPIFSYQGYTSSAFTAGKVDFVNLEVTWQMKKTGSQTWEDIATTKNQVFVTLKEPIKEGETSSGNPVSGYWHFESCFHIGCMAAAGSTTEESVVENVWQKFQNADLLNAKGEELRYYDEDNWIEAENNRSIKKLLGDHNGQCTAWVEMFIDILKSMGVQQNLQVTTFDHLGPPVSLPVWDDGFFVNSWNYLPVSNWFADDPVAQAYVEEGYRYILVLKNIVAPPVTTDNTYSFGYKEMDELSGAPGQNSGNPQSIFNFHQVCKVGDKYYDPSYGGPPFDIAGFLNNYQENNISGYYKLLRIQNIVENDYNTDLNGDGIISTEPKTMLIYFVKKHITYTGDPILAIFSEIDR